MAARDAALRQPANVVVPPVLTVNADGASPFVLVCDHASNRIPEPYGTLGLTLQQRLMHIAWDPGALAVSLELSTLLDAPLVHSTVSRLVIDCNRTHEAIDLVPVVSERTDIPGNVGIGDNDRWTRVQDFHTPFHDAVTTVLDRRLAAGAETILVTIHSFTPVYRDVVRPWPIGLIHGVDERFSRAMLEALSAEPGCAPVGWNEPYSARAGVTFTLEHHGDGRGLEATMIEIRHDGILDAEGVSTWAGRLARALGTAHAACRAAPIAAQ